MLKFGDSPVLVPDHWNSLIGDGAGGVVVSSILSIFIPKIGGRLKVPIGGRLKVPIGGRLKVPS